MISLLCPNFIPGRWLPLFETPTATVTENSSKWKGLKVPRVITGVQLITITMLTPDLDAGFCVSKEMCAVEEAAGEVRIVW